MIIFEDIKKTIKGFGSSKNKLLASAFALTLSAGMVGYTGNGSNVSIDNYTGSIRVGESIANSGELSELEQQKKAYEEMVDTLENKRMLVDESQYKPAGFTRCTKGRFSNATNQIYGDEVFVRGCFNDSMNMILSESRFGGKNGPLFAISYGSTTNRNINSTYIAKVNNRKITSIHRGEEKEDMNLDWGSYIDGIALAMEHENQLKNYTNTIRNGEKFKKYGNSKFFNELGNAYYRIENLDKSFFSFYKAYRMDSNNIENRFNLGAIYARKGNKTEALKHLNWVRNKDPNVPNLNAWIKYAKNS